MSREQGRAVSGHLRTLLGEGVTSGWTDGQLLERFGTRRGDAAEVAFGTLLERHGPMVLGACRKILRDEHEAEDAFQATFLVLAVKGPTLWVEDSIGPWLHRVACRIALRARVAAGRRSLLERTVARDAAALSALERTDALGGVLHEEIDRLPWWNRVPIVLCDLEGHSYEEAARHLGCPVGTIKSRLARGRNLLRSRLTRRGFAPTAAIGIAGRMPSFETGTPLALADSLIQKALANTSSRSVPAAVASLAEGMLKVLSFARWVRGVQVGLAAGALIAGMGLLAYRTEGSPPQAGAEPAAATPAPAQAPAKPDLAEERTKAVPEIVARVANIGRDAGVDGLIRMVAIDPATSKWRTLATNLPPGPVSPDGRYLVYSQLGPNHDAADLGIWIYDLTTASPPRRIFDRNGVPHWSDHGRKVVVGVPAGSKFETWRVNADGTGRTRLPIPETDLVLDCARDGTWLATRTIRGEPAHNGRLTLVRPDGTEAHVLTQGSARGDLFAIFRLSPDGRQVAVAEVRTTEGVRTSKLSVMDIEGRRPRELPITFEPDTSVGVSWSPDGLRLALNVMNSRTKEGALGLVDVDGKNYRMLTTPPGLWNLHVCGWESLAPGGPVGDLDKLTRPDASTPQGRYRALLEEVAKAKPFEPSRYVDRFLELAEAHPEDRVAVDAWIWIVTSGFDGPTYWRAIDRLVGHAGTVKVGHAAMGLSGSASPSAGKLLRAAFEENDSRVVKGLVSVALGGYLKNQAETLRMIEDDPEQGKQWERLFLEQGSTREGFDRFVAQDPEALMKQAEAWFERTVGEFADVSRSRDLTLGQEAQAELDEIRNLRVDKPAPEIGGKDVNGVPFRLSEYRGKVVVLRFWGDWCGSSRATYDVENALASRMKGRPFALLGVNSDGDEDTLKTVITAKGITWRSWRDGGGSANTRGPIARRFNVRTWPTFYVLDHRGIIRHKFVGSPRARRLDELVDALVKAREDEGNGPEE